MKWKAGLEIHQQLSTEKKLFCHCSSQLVEAEPNFKTVRYFRPTLSEKGKLDPTALKAFKRRKKVVYNTDLQKNCLYELNETPPFEINSEALQAALFFSKLLNAKIPDGIPISRKQYLDGSVPSGFQRTMIVGFHGELKLSSGKVLEIVQISLEEDAARKVEEDDEEIVFKTDRLGIPLIEVTTAPQLTTFSEVREAALKLGSIFRSVDKARRGLGSIRQDLNISIEGGSRVEIKGVQRPEWFEPLIKEEIKRQQNLKKITKELGKRAVKREKIENSELKLVSTVFENTDSQIVKNALEEGKNLYAFTLPGFEGLLDREIQSNKTFGKEFADRVSKTVGLGGIIHTDELPNYGIDATEKERLFEILGRNKKKDTVLVLIGKKKKVEDAIEEIKERAIQSLTGVPKETRHARKDGTTSFQRPLGTAARLYPDTDTPPIFVPSDLLQKIEKKRKNTTYPWKKKEKYIRLGINEDLAETLSLSNKNDLFEEIIDMNVDPNLVATTLLEKMKELEREGYNVNAIQNEKIKTIFRKLEKRKIAKEVIPDILKKLAQNQEKTVDEVLDSLGISTLSREDLDEVIANLIRENQEYVAEQGMNAFKGLMGDAMREVKGKIDGEIVANVLREKLSSYIEEIE